MNIYLLLFVVTIIILVLFYYNNSQYVFADNGNVYLLHNAEPAETAKESANALDRINTSNVILIDYLLKTFPNVSWILKLNSNYKRDGSSISEASISKDLTSYTVDKTDMNICLRTRTSQNILYDYNTLMYVDIHELAHMGNYDNNDVAIEGHGSEFIEKFKFLLKNAIKLGIYKWENYNLHPKEYCGITITSQILSNQFTS